MMLDKYTLTTREGAKVAEVEIPHFVNPPEVVVWGARYFIPTYTPFEYKEAFVAWAPVKQTREL